MKRNVRKSGRYVAGGAALAVLLAIPFFADAYESYIVQTIAYQVLIAVGLSLLMGYTGQGSIAHPGFAAIGGYLSTIFVTRYGVPFWAAVPASALFAGATGYLLGFPALRLSGHYLLLVTLGFLQIVLVILMNGGDLTGGAAGMRAAVPVIGTVRFGSTDMLYWLIIPVTFVMVVLAFNVVDSRIGRAFTAIRDSEVAAAAVGIDVARYKTLAFGISGFYAGLAGALYAPIIGFLDPTEFTILTAIAQITFLVVGGLYSLWGAILGAVIMTMVPEMLRAAQEYRELAFGVILLLFLLFAPAGIAGQIERLAARYRHRTAPIGTGTPPTGKTRRPAGSQ